RLTNTGSAYCEVSGAAYHCADAVGLGQCDPPAFTVGAPSASRLGPGEVATVDVTFTPQLLGVVGVGASGGETLEHAAVIATDDDDHLSVASGLPGVEPGSYVVALAGAANAGIIEVVPRVLDFGLVTRGCRSPERCLRVHN